MRSCFITEPRWCAVCDSPLVRQCRGIAIPAIGSRRCYAVISCPLITAMVESLRVEITPGEVEWEQPNARVHRAVNVGELTYEQVTVFLLNRPDVVAQPSSEEQRIRPF